MKSRTIKYLKGYKHIIDNDGIGDRGYILDKSTISPNMKAVGPNIPISIAKVSTKTLLGALDKLSANNGKRLKAAGLI